MATKPIPERNFIILRWHYCPSRETQKLNPNARESFPVSEDVYTTYAAALQDVADGQVEAVQAVHIDLDAGTSQDITAEILDEASEIRADREDARRCYGRG